MGINRLYDRVQRLDRIQLMIGRTEKLLAGLKARAEELEMELIPEEVFKMTTDGDYKGIPATGEPSVKLPDGRTVVVTREFHASVNKPDREAFHEYLRDQGQSKMIKTVLTVICGVKGRLQAGNIAKAIRAKYGFESEIEDSVHGRTLKVWARKELEAGRTLPPEVKLWAPTKAVILALNEPLDIRLHPITEPAPEHPDIPEPNQEEARAIVARGDQIGNPYAETSTLPKVIDPR